MALPWPYDATPYDDLFRQSGTRYGVDPRALRTMASLESNFNVNAISPQGARGLMQFMPATGQQYGITDDNWRDPRAQVDASARYYKSLLDEFEGNSEHALAAYNMGPARFRELGMRYDALPETKAHIERYRERYGPVDERAPDTYNLGDRGRNILRSVVQRDDPTGGTPLQAGDSPLRRLFDVGDDRRRGQAGQPDLGELASDVRPASSVLRSALFDGPDTAGIDDPRRSGDSPRGGGVWDALFPISAGSPGEPPQQPPQATGLRSLFGDVGGTDGDPAAGGPATEPFRNPFPMGSRAYFEFAHSRGGLPAIRSPIVEEGELLPGTEDPHGGNWGEVDDTYPIQFMGRIRNIIDADTFDVEEMGTGNPLRLRLSDVDAAESRGAERTEEGVFAAAWMRDAIPVGSQVVVETKAGGWDGKYGRPLGKAYVRTPDGRTIDLSAPVLTGEETVRDAFLNSDDVQGLLGTAKGLAGSAALDPVEIAQFVSQVGDWVGLNDTSVGSIDSKLSEWEERLKDIQHDFVSKGYDRDRRTYNVPALGNISVGELGRGLTSSAAYTLGLTWALSKAYKAGRAGIRAARYIGKTDPAAQVKRVQEYTDYLRKLRYIIGKDAVKGVARGADLDDWVRRGDALTDRLKETIHSVEPPKPFGEMSAKERIIQLKDLWVTFATDKYHPFLKLSKKMGDDEGMGLALNQLRAAGDVANAPLSSGIVHMAKHSDGHTFVSQISKPLTDHWEFVPMKTFDDMGAYMQFKRMVDDIWPRRRAREVALQKAGKSPKAIAKILKKEGVPDATMNQWKHAKERMREIEDVYKNNVPGDPDGLGWKDLQDRMDKSYQWMVDAVLKPLLEVGEITRKEYDDLLATGGAYAPWTRLNLDFIGDLMGPEAAMEILRAENNMLHGSKTMAVAGKGISEKAVAKSPLSRLRGGLGPRKKVEDLAEGELPIDMGDMALDMWQSLTMRVPAVTKYVNQQRVRNMLGDTIDELMGRGDKWLGKTMKVVSRAENPQLFEKVSGGAVGNAFVKNVIKPDGTKDKMVYMTFDESLAAAIEVMSPAQMSLFKKIMTNKATRALTAPTRLFRAGTVLGLGFMVRNPVRDQLMAATLTKYGYIPVIDFWRGMFNVMTESPLYKTLQGAGGTQAGFHAHDIETVNKGIVDLTTAERLPDALREAFRPDVQGSQALHAVKTLGNVPRMRSALREQGAHISRQVTSKFDNPIKRQFAIGQYALRSISELFEEATRVGAVRRAIGKAAKGKRYTVARSVDEAVGGASGWARLFTGRADYKKLGARYKAARNVTPWQQKQAKEYLAGEGPAHLSADMIDEVRNITLDFNRNGIMGEVINAFYPFFNAEMQDYSRFMRAMREAPLTTSLRAFTFISMPAIANWYMNFDNPDYQAEGDIEKELFLHPFGFNKEYKKFGRISRPIGTISGAYGLLPHKMLDWYAANKPGMIKTIEEELWPGKNLRRMRDAFTEDVSGAVEAMPEGLRMALGVASMGYFPTAGVAGPIPEGERAKVEGDPYSLNVPVSQYMMEQARNYVATQTAAKYVVPKDPNENIMGRISPQFVSPIAKIMSNYDWFFDSPITPPRLDRADLLAKDVWTEQTMPLEKMFSAAINTVSPVDINPMETGFLWRAYTGGLGSSLLSGGDQLLTAIGAQPSRPSVPKDITDVFPAKPFWSREPWGSSSKPVREMYDEWDRVKRVLNSMEHNKKAGDYDRTVDIMREHPEFMAGQILKKGVEELSVFHNARRSILANTNITDEHRADLLMMVDQNITKYAHEMMMAYYKVKRDPAITSQLFANLP